MNPSDPIFLECLVQLKQDEGFRSHAYVCPAGALTIGIGRNVDTGGPGISEAEAQVMLANDITECDADCRSLYTRWDMISPRRRATLVNLRFQIGGGGLRGFKMMNAAINADDWEAAGRELANSRLMLQTPKRTARRVRELEEG